MVFICLPISKHPSIVATPGSGMGTVRKPAGLSYLWPPVRQVLRLRPRCPRPPREVSGKPLPCRCLAARRRAMAHHIVPSRFGGGKAPGRSQRAPPHALGAAPHRAHGAWRTPPGSAVALVLLRRLRPGGRCQRLGPVGGLLPGAVTLTSLRTPSARACARLQERLRSAFSRTSAFTGRGWPSFRGEQGAAPLAAISHRGYCARLSFVA